MGELSRVDFSVVDGELIHHVLGSFEKVGIVSIIEGKVGVATVVVGNGVPDSVEVVSTANVGNGLVVASLVAVGVVVADTGNSVEGLVNVSDVVNNETKGEGKSVVLVGEVLNNLLVVEGRFEVSSTAQHISEG